MKKVLTIFILAIVIAGTTVMATPKVVATQSDNCLKVGDSVTLIERSNDAKNFSVINQLQANSTKKYQINDLNIMANDKYLYYRLRSVDINQEIRLSNIIKVAMNGKIVPIIFGPNTVKSSDVNIFASGIDLTNTTVRISSMNGRVIKQQKFGNGSISVGELSPGLYIFSLIDIEGKELDSPQKILKQ